jgi:tetratricopeptide (TPR) repeat protein
VEAAEIVSRHLVMTERLLESNPALAWEHAKAAVARGGRLAVVREAAGIAGYAAGEYADALAQFRAARRISGSDSYWPIMADCERGLGRPERAIGMAGAPEVDRLDRAGRVEMRIVASGARRDLGQDDAAVVTLQCPELSASSTESWSARLKYAYADALLAVGRDDEAREWFEQAAEVDVEQETEAAERLAELDGLVWVDTLDGHDVELAEPDTEAVLDEGEDEDEDEDDEDLADVVALEFRAAPDVVLVGPEDGRHGDHVDEVRRESGQEPDGDAGLAGPSDVDVDRDGQAESDSTDA